MPTIFLSHSSADKPFARRLANRLERAGIAVWIDEAELNVGDSLLHKIADAIDKADYVAAIISSHSVQSSWVQKELQLAMTKEIHGQEVVVLPIKIDDCVLPSFLTDKLYADFTPGDNFDSEVRRLIRSVGVRSPTKSRASSTLRPSQTPDSSLLYAAKDGRYLLMIQAFADRPEWGGPSYHCTNPRRRLNRILKVYGRKPDSVGEPTASECISNSVSNILHLDPDIIGFGGMGKTTVKIRARLEEAGFDGEIGYWGGDAGIDACEFLKRYGVDPKEW